MIKKIARDKHPRVVIISLKVVSFTSFLDLQKKSSILSTWYVTIVFLRSRVPPFFSIYFLFLTKLWAVCVQNYTSDDNENNKTKSKIHTVIYPGSSVPLHLFTIFFFPFFSGVQGGVLFRSLLDIKKKKFVDFVKVRVLELCTLSRAPPFFSVHFFLWRNFKPFVLVTTTKKNFKKNDSKIFIVFFSGHLLFFIYLFSFLRGGGWMRGDGFNWTPKKRIHILTWPGPRTVL